MAGHPTGDVSVMLGKPRSTVIDMANQALDGIQTYLEGASNGTSGTRFRSYTDTS